MLTPFDDEIWIVDGPEVAVIGFRYPTRMAIIRLSDGGVFIWSPIALTESLRAAIDVLGPVRHIVASNPLHHLFMLDWKRAYPDARMYAPPVLRRKRQDIAFDHDLGRAEDHDWHADIDQVAMRGNRITTEIVFFHIRSGTVLFTDLLQQFPARWFSGWRAVLAKWDLMLEPEPSVPRKFRIAFTDRRAARASPARILAWPTGKVVMAHGTPVTANGKAYIEPAFAWLER